MKIRFKDLVAQGGPGEVLAGGGPGGADLFDYLAALLLHIHKVQPIAERGLPRWLRVLADVEPIGGPLHIVLTTGGQRAAFAARRLNPALPAGAFEMFLRRLDRILAGTARLFLRFL